MSLYFSIAKINSKVAFDGVKWVGPLGIDSKL